MLDHPLQDIEDWVVLFSNNPPPVLRITRRRLQEMARNLDKVDTRELSRIVLQDPIMTLRVLAFIQPIHGKSLQHDITTIASAIMMMGIHPFFHHFKDLQTVEDQLGDESQQALLGILRIIRRAQRAADFAQEWAIWRYDINMEEVRIAALLHDLAEILVWAFAPTLGLAIQGLQKAHPDMRSADAQRAILGMTFQDIQLALCRAWHLPELLLTLIDDEQAEQERVRNVSYAVRLARHSASGWDNPALPDDYKDIGLLLNLSPDAVRQRLGLQPMPALAGQDDEST